MVVAHGFVSSGAWSVRWTSTGHASTAQAAAHLEIAGLIKGRVGGTAAKPVVRGTWTIRGAVHVTRPVTSTAPINDHGADSEAMTLSRTSCDGVSGSFVPSFNSKSAAASFAGTAQWTGTPVE
ncbi:MAG: hypothetical protein JWP74_40 [Marmoricola sp.]|nr:hypothetical protein [Marmoricola sp.]